MDDTGYRMASDGHIWVCLACGKVSKDKHQGHPGSWWDASCMLNSEMVPERLLDMKDGRVVNIRDESETTVP